MQKEPKLSVILPAYNEAENIGRTVGEVSGFLLGFPLIGDAFEIIVVDDGSRDKTGEIIEGMAAVDARIRLVRHGKNQGYGQALRSGFDAARGELIFFMDSDGQFVFSEIAKMFPAIEQYDGVLGYRMQRQDNLIRKINGLGWTFLTSLLFGLRIRDMDCAFKLFQRSVIKENALVSGGALINAEILARAKIKGCRFIQVGVTHRPRLAGKQTGAKLGVILRAFVELFRLYRRIKSGN